MGKIASGFLTLAFSAALAVPHEQASRIIQIVGDLAAQQHVTALMDSLTAER